MPTSRHFIEQRGGAYLQARRWRRRRCGISRAVQLPQGVDEGAEPVAERHDGDGAEPLGGSLRERAHRHAAHLPPGPPPRRARPRVRRKKRASSSAGSRPARAPRGRIARRARRGRGWPRRRAGGRRARAPGLRRRRGRCRRRMRRRGRSARSQRGQER